jgi:hypothetical protein
VHSPALYPFRGSSRAAAGSRSRRIRPRIRQTSLPCRTPGAPLLLPAMSGAKRTPEAVQTPSPRVQGNRRRTHPHHRDHTDSQQGWGIRCPRSWPLSEHVGRRPAYFPRGRAASYLKFVQARPERRARANLAARARRPCPRYIRRARRRGSGTENRCWYRECDSRTKACCSHSILRPSARFEGPPRPRLRTLQCRGRQPPGLAGTSGVTSVR